MTRVLVIDDEPQVRLALRSALARAGFEVLLAADGREGFETLATAAPEVVVLDLWLPDTDGLTLVRTLRTWSSVPVLILSGVSDQARRVAVLEAGADDFLQKPFGLDELVARLRALLRRTQTSGDDELQRSRQFGSLEVDLASRAVSREGEALHLTPTEWRLLEALVTNPGKLLTHRWLLHTVWDAGHGDETRAALRAHLRSLRAKIGDDATSPIFVATESGAGYRWIAVEGTAPELPAAPTAPEDGFGTMTPGSDAEVGRSRVSEEVTHELNNALTALRLALHVVRSRAERAGDDASRELSPPLERFDAALARVSGLVVELERIASNQIEASEDEQDEEMPITDDVLPELPPASGD
ncbi:response regulator transcription factor [Nocardioides sp. GY 10127]|uniref:response regulator transcription factor n=1 Tax=Nocardioides sp. GY 10127 TaxID=2569762 RepID=UPI0010A81FFE|nr:response regulator transcription factor [Nocardioides sp. GY 10127]TIC86577.1 response regulator transcription factor [Nocardioides sp. GY 10127]